MSNTIEPHLVSRRNFIKVSSALATGAAFAGFGELPSAFGEGSAGKMLAEGVPNAEKLGWRVGVQSFTFHKFFLLDVIDMTASLGLKYIETCPGHRISKEEPHGIYSGSEPKYREMVKRKLQETGIIHTSHYEPLSAEFAPRVFSFCKDMGLEMLITDPPRIASGPGSIEWYEKLATEHGVKLVLTNHPKPEAAYSDPEQIVEDCQGRSEWVGASCDPGHFMRGGFAPKDAVDKYIKIGKMYHFHFRDVDKIGPGGVDVPLGDGVADIPGILQELQRHNLKPLFQIEYERDFENPMAQMIPSVKYLNDLCGKLLASQKETSNRGA
jgi:sugar phosphate isomerase/epimerase